MDNHLDMIDPATGILLTPSYHGKDCLGNGAHPGYECCCDECDFYLECFPELDIANKKGLRAALAF